MKPFFFLKIKGYTAGGDGGARRRPRMSQLTSASVSSMFPSSRHREARRVRRNTRRISPGLSERPPLSRDAADKSDIIEGSILRVTTTRTTTTRVHSAPARYVIVIADNETSRRPAEDRGRRRRPLLSADA